MNEPITTTGTPATTTVAPITPPASADWTAGFNDDLKGYVQNKQFKDPATVLDSYRNLEKLVGVKEKLIQVPDKEDAPEWNAVYDRLGRPKEAKDYSFTTPEGADAKFTEAAKAKFHELGITQKQAAKLVEWDNATKAALTSAQTEAAALEFKNQDAALRKEWGAALEQNIAIAKRAASALGFDGPTIDKLESAMGHSSVMKLMHNLGSKLGEGKFVAGDAPGFKGALTPQAAQQKIQSLQTDTDFIRRFKTGDSSAKEEFDRLHQFAYPSEA